MIRNYQGRQLKVLFLLYEFNMANLFAMGCIYVVISSILSVISQVLSSYTPDTLSLELGSTDLQNSDIVQIANPPKTIKSGMWLQIDYRCSRDRFVGVEITATVDKQTHTIFQKVWKCHHIDGKTNIKKRRVKIKLPDNYAYREDLFNSKSILVTQSKLMAWNLDSSWWQSARKNNEEYFRSSAKVSYKVNLLPPFSRPSKEGIKTCTKWPLKMLSKLNFKKIKQCPYQKEIIETVYYPAAMNGQIYGIVRSFENFTDPDLEQMRINLLTRPVFTFSIWIYILEYCEPREVTLCSIMYQSTWNNQYLSPLLFINKQGKLHIQMTDINKETYAALTGFAVPKQEWCRLVFKFTGRKWLLTMNYGENFKHMESTAYRMPAEVYMDDTEGVFVFGGLDTTSTFRGYIGQATYYRNKALDADKIPFPSPYHPMFELGLTRREGRCIGFISWVSRRYRLHKFFRFKSLSEESCKPYFAKFLKNMQSEPRDQCPFYTAPRPKSYAYIDSLLKRKVEKNRPFSYIPTADQLYKRAMHYVDRGLKQVKKAAPLLRQSACLGNRDAMYMWAVILNNGVTVKADEIQAQAYLMMGALDKHRLCCLALANKHNYGLDGVPADQEQAYMYYKYVADKTREDKDRHKETDVMTESVRLTDEVQLKEQTDEEGDVFQWLKHQAGKGVLSAQKQVARLLFWGQQGMKRNMETAVQYYKMGAEAEDPQAMYDYGIVLLRGQGVKSNKTQGLSHIKRSAEKKHPDAVNALGWYAMNFKHNTTEAVELFEQAYRLGHSDAAYNLGSLHLNGMYPNRSADYDLALSYFNFAGKRNQLEAGAAIAFINIKGTGRQKRDVHVAVEWSRFTAEKNPAIGFLLRKGLHAYRNGDIPVSMFYYLMAADAGTEIGSFNLAFLCEENSEGIVTTIEKDCQWRHYNQSIQRETQFVDPYALIKMGDYYWYGCGQRRDAGKAAELYTQAALKGDPHAIFNLGFMAEEGAKFSPSLLWALRLPGVNTSDYYSVLKALYKRCQQSRNTEAYLPCSIALYRIRVLEIWYKYYTILKILGFFLVSTTTVLSLYSIIRHLRSSNHRLNIDI